MQLECLLGRAMNMENYWNLLTIIIFPLFGAGFWLCWNRVGEHIIATALVHQSLIALIDKSQNDLRNEVLRYLERIEKKLDRINHET